MLREIFCLLVLIQMGYQVYAKRPYGEEEVADKLQLQLEVRVGSWLGNGQPGSKKAPPRPSKGPPRDKSQGIRIPVIKYTAAKGDPRRAHLMAQRRALLAQIAAADAQKQQQQQYSQGR